MNKLLKRARCLLKGHEPNRNRVRRVTRDLYIGYCQHCGLAIKRLGPQRWVRDPEPELHRQHRHPTNEADAL